MICKLDLTLRRNCINLIEVVIDREEEEEVVHEVISRVKMWRTVIDAQGPLRQITTGLFLTYLPVNVKTTTASPDAADTRLRGAINFKNNCERHNGPED